MVSCGFHGLSSATGGLQSLADVCKVARGQGPYFLPLSCSHPIAIASSSHHKYISLWDFFIPKNLDLNCPLDRVVACLMDHSKIKILVNWLLACLNISSWRKQGIREEKKTACFLNWIWPFHCFDLWIFSLWYFSYAYSVSCQDRV